MCQEKAMVAFPFLLTSSDDTRAPDNFCQHFCAVDVIAPLCVRWTLL